MFSLLNFSIFLNQPWSDARTCNQEKQKRQGETLALLNHYACVTCDSSYRSPKNVTV